MKIRFLSHTLLAFLFVFAIFQARATVTVDSSAPDTLIKTLGDHILETIRADNEVKTGNKRRILEIVNTILLPYTDFNQTTRSAMGRYWRQATPEQQQQIIEQFKLLLVYTYSGATTKIGDQTFTVRPLRVTPADSDVVVRTDVNDQGRKISVDYRLRKTNDKIVWKIYDVNVMGAWLIETYRQQFSTIIAQNGIDGLIQFLTKRNETLAKR